MNFLYFDDVIMQANSNKCRINGTAVSTLNPSSHSCTLLTIQRSCFPIFIIAFKLLFLKIYFYCYEKMS